MKVPQWNKDDWKSNLSRRLSAAKKSRKSLEAQWERNEEAIYNASGGSFNGDVGINPSEGMSAAESEGAAENVAINNILKYIRFLHAQMSANPPSVMVAQVGKEMADAAKAEAADQATRWGRRQFNIQEKVDQMNLKVLTKGTGFIRTSWDANRGEILEFDVKTRELLMTGDHSIYSPSTWDIWIDPAAKSWDEVRYVFEAIHITKEELLVLFPDQKDDIDKVTSEKVGSRKSFWHRKSGNDGSGEGPDEVVTIYEYFEKASPINAMAGRHGFCLSDGCVLGEPGESPSPDGSLPYDCLTDIDVEDQVWGKSIIEYLEQLQDVLNRLDSSDLANISAHNVCRLVVPETADLADDSITNSAYDIVKITGNQAPYFMQSPSLMPDATRFRAQLNQGEQELAGVNESMLGQIKRETSGFSMQTAINAGNMVRRRLYNKYTLVVENIYRKFLGNIIKYWDEPRTIKVLGEEKAFEVADLLGTDIAGGWDIVTEYGASLSLDPSTRREEIMQLMPVLEKAGMPTRTIIRHLRLNELDSLYDNIQMAERRQKEIFDEMVANYEQKGESVYISPEKWQDHANMIPYCQYFVMTARFKYMSKETQQLIVRHLEDREKMWGEMQAAAQGAPPAGAPAGLPPEMMEAMPPEMQGQLPPAELPPQ
jgi:hypothetical protein